MSGSSGSNRSHSKVQTHASNTARINSLRNTIAQQNDLVTSHLTLLAETRADLLSTPSSVSAIPRKDNRRARVNQTESKDERKVTYTDLLAYAKHIARFNPTQRGPFRSTTTNAQPVPVDSAVAIASAPDNETQKSPRADGVPTADTKMSQGTTDPEKEGRGIEDLSQMEKQWLDPYTGVLVTPWPGEDILKRGGLAELQAIAERGGNVGGGDDPAAGERDGSAANDDAFSMGEGMDLLTAGGPTALENGQAAGPDSGSGSGSAAARMEKAREEKPKVFGGLDLYDPDEE